MMDWSAVPKAVQPDAIVAIGNVGSTRRPLE